jgi:hypothetical protein
MAKTLTATDRKSLIKLASTLPVGSGERRVILAGLKKEAGFGTYRDQLGVFISGFTTEARNLMLPMIKGDGLPVYRPRNTNGVNFGTQPVQMTFDLRGSHKPGKVTARVLITSKEFGDLDFLSRDLTDMEPKQVAAWIWKSTPARYKQ